MPIELVISVKRVRVKDWCKASPLSVMTLLFIGPYFISSSVSGKSFPHGTIDTMMFIYSVHITCGQLNDLSFVSARKQSCFCQDFSNVLMDIVLVIFL